MFLSQPDWFCLGLGTKANLADYFFFIEEFFA